MIALRRRPGWAVVAGLVLGVACRESTGPRTVISRGPSDVAEVTVTPAVASLSIGARIQFVATPRDAAGHVLAGHFVSWTSANDAVATVDSTGSVTGVGVATVAITATSEGRQGTATVTVTATTPLSGTIAFTSERDGNDEIYVMNADGSHQTRLTNDPASDREPAWSPDGSRIAFASNRDGTFQIYLMNADGSSLTRLTNDPATDDQPAWSIDGRKIAFTSDRDGSANIYSMNADGSSATRLTAHAAPMEVGFAAWSPDGTRIAYVEWLCNPPPDGCAGSTEIMNADGSGDHGVVAGGGRLAWSPDGARIAFGAGQILVLFLDEPGRIDLIDPGIGGQHVEPAWSPDGTRIAFASTGCYTCSTTDIYVMSADGSGVVRLTDRDARNYAPAWRP